MRLVDADALSEYLDKRRTYEIMDGRNKAYGKGVRDAMKDLEDAPTIDAIPVEWLNERHRKCCEEGDTDLMDAITVLCNEYHVWQKEQEAQDE